MSASGAPPPTQRLHSAIIALLALIRPFKAAVDHIGVQMIPLKWKQVNAAIAAAETALGTTPGATFEALDNLESAARNAEYAYAQVCDPNITTEATQAMSQAWALRISYEVKAMKEANDTVTSAIAALSASLRADVHAESASSFGSKPRGGLATDLYVNILKASGESSLLEKTKTSIFGDGVPPDARITGADSKSADAKSAVISYNYEPLVSRVEALKSGPLAMTTSGLNYKLVQRLRTMYYAADAKSVELRVPGRIIAYNECAGAAVNVPAVAAATERLKGYESRRAELEPKLVCAPDPLLANLRDAFAEAWQAQYGKTAPTSVREFMGFAVPVALGGSYIARAVATSTIGQVDKHLIRPLHSASNTKVPFDAAKCEIMVSHTLQVMSMAKKLARKLQDALTFEIRATATAGLRAAWGRAAARAVAAVAGSAENPFGVTPTLKLAN